MSNSTDNNLTKFFVDYPYHESFLALNNEYRYRINAQEKFLQSYKEYFQSDLQERLLADDVKHTDGFDKLVMKLLRQSLIW